MTDILNFSHTVAAQHGLHMRNSGALSALAQEFDARIILIHGDSGAQASADNPLSTMLLNIREGDVVHFSISSARTNELKSKIIELL